MDSRSVDVKAYASTKQGVFNALLHVTDLDVLPTRECPLIFETLAASLIDDCSVVVKADFSPMQSVFSSLRAIINPNILTFTDRPTHPDIGNCCIVVCRLHTYLDVTASLTDSCCIVVENDVSTSQRLFSALLYMTVLAVLSAGACPTHLDINSCCIVVGIDVSEQQSVFRLGCTHVHT